MRLCTVVSIFSFTKFYLLVKHFFSSKTGFGLRHFMYTIFHMNCNCYPSSIYLIYILHISACSVGKHPSGFLISQAECQRLLMECHHVTRSSCDIIHNNCAKIIKVRAKAGLLEDLVHTDFLSLVRHVEEFVRRSALITGIQFPTLRTALQSQAKNFLEKFHENRRSEIG